MTNMNTRIEKFTAGATIAIGDILKFDSDGTVILQDTAEATDSAGIAYSNAVAGEPVSVVVYGPYTAHALVEDTDGSSGYDKAIVPGDKLIVSGKAAGTYGVGQALSAVGGTQTITANLGEIVGTALQAEAGSTSADTYVANLQVFVNFL